MALTLPASHVVRKPKKHRDSVAKSVATSLLKDVLAEETVPSIRDKVSAAVRELETPETIARKRKASFRNTSAMSEQGIWEADQKHPAFRVVCRMLRAGQAFSYLGNSKKAQCVTDIGRLLGYLYDTKTFPVRGGRSFIAGVLCTLLGRPVSLVDIIRWFPVINSQDMTVHQELLGLLSSLGMTWPPHAHVFPDCKQTYKAINKPASGLGQACESLQTSTSVDESATFVEEMSALWNPGMGGARCNPVVPYSCFGTNPAEALEDDVQDLA